MSIQDIAAKLKGYRTIAFNVAVGVAGAFYGQEVIDAITATGLSADAAIDAVVAFVVAANVALRFLTNTKVGQRY